MIEAVVVLDTPKPNVSRYNLKEPNTIPVHIPSKYIKESIPSKYKRIKMLLYLKIFCYFISVLGLTEQLLTHCLKCLLPSK